MKRAIIEGFRRARRVWVRFFAGLSVVILALWLVHGGYREWKTTVDTSTLSACEFLSSGDSGEHFRIMHLNIESQAPSVPEFEGVYVVNLGHDLGKRQLPLAITVTSTTRSNYRASGYTPILQWDNRNDVLWMTPERISFIPTRSHYMFPFDSASFDETFLFTPPIDVRGVHLENHVAGFYLPCSTFRVHTEAGTAKISFELRRNAVIVYAAVELLVVAAVFAVAITLFVETRSLAQSLAAFFFAVWSIRAIFGLTAETFPTILDFVLLLLVSSIPILLILRVLGLPKIGWGLVCYGRKIVRTLEGREG